MASIQASMLDLDAVKRVATQCGARENGNDFTQSVARFKTSGGVDVTVFYDTGSVAIATEHPRLGAVNVLRADVDLTQLTEIFGQPLSGAPFGYKGALGRSLPLENEERTIQRQLAQLEREKQHIAMERAELKRRAAEAGFEIQDMAVGGNSRSRGSRGSEDDEVSGMDSATEEAIQLLFKQQSEVNAKLEELVSRQTASKGNKAARGGKGANSYGAPTSGPASGGATAGRSQSSSLRKGAAPRASGREHDTSGPRVPFQAQKSVINHSANQPTAAAVNSPFRQKGNQCCYALAKSDYHEEFGNAWSAKPANVVALGRGYVIIYDDGSVTWWDLPDLLDKKLKDQGEQVKAVRYVALGPDENYYVKFMDGKMEWCGPDAFGEALKKGVHKNRLLVDKVAFAPNQGWLVLWSDGSLEHSRVPTSLAQLLEEMGPDEAVKDIAMGPNEEWFVIFKDNSVRADNLPDGLYRIMSDIQEKGGRVRQVIFGENCSWYVRYWDGKA